MSAFRVEVDAQELEELLNWASDYGSLVQLVGKHLVAFPPAPRAHGDKVAWQLEEGESVLEALVQVLTRAREEHEAFLIEVRNLAEQRKARSEEREAERAKKGRR